MQPTQRETKAWIEAVARHMNMSPSRLALQSGMAASTLTRYLNDGTGTIGISQTSLDRIAQFSGVPVHRMPGERAGGFQEEDAIPLDRSETATDRTRRAVDAIAEGRNHVFPLEMKGWALDLQGILPGDVLVFDMNARAKPDDIVCVQRVDWTTGDADTLVRIYKPPMVLAHSAKLGPLAPLMVDEDRVSIRGVMIGAIRVRH